MSALLVASAVLLLYAVWRLVRAYFVSSPLDNIPGPKPASLFAGNAGQLFDREGSEFMRTLIDEYGPVSRIQAFLGAKWLHVYDPKTLHHVLVKDADLFNRSTSGNAITEMLIGPGLLSTEGERHKRQKKLLNPVFSASHMRNMTPFFYEVTAKLKAAIEGRVGTREEIDIQGWLSRTALELVGQGLLGHSFDPLTEETSDEFTEAVKALVPTLNGIQWIRIILPLIPYLGPAWFRRKILDLIPLNNVQRLKNVSDILHRHSVQIYEERKKAALRGDESMVDRVGAGKDVMSLFVKGNMEAKGENVLPDEELIAQMSTFILGGVDTTSNALARTLHLLALHPDVQTRLRAELVEAQERYGEQVPYNELSQLPYLDAVCRETMRLYSPAALSAREALKDTVVPITEPIRGLDGGLITEVTVPKGTFLILNLRACNTNQALWGEDALEWKPERWLAPLPREIEEARIPGIYSNLMTFGAGGYSCIGFKFSQLEMKVVLLTLVRSFKFTLPEKPIIWNAGGVEFPTMGGGKAEMVLNIQRVE